MIAKAVPAPKGASGIVGLARYISGVKDKGDPVGWPSLVDYITDAKSDGARVEYVRLSNLDSIELGPAVKEIEATQAMNTRSRSGKVYHLVISFPPGERPTREQLDDIEDRLVAAIGFGEHQRLSAAHGDKDHFHLHVAISKVHPETHRNVSPSWDKLALMRTCAELELKHGLQITNHGQSVEQGPRGRAADMEAHDGRESFQRWIAENAAPHLVKAAGAAKGWQELHQAAAEHGLALRLRGAGLIITTEDGRARVKASSVDRSLSLQALTSRFGAFEERGQGPTKPARQEYRQTAREAGGSALFEAFTRERNAALAARTKARTERSAAIEIHRNSMRERYAERRSLIKRSIMRTGHQKKLAYGELARERASEWKAIFAKLAGDEAAVKAAHPVKTWTQFLEDRAEAGDTEALALLRTRRIKQADIAAAIYADTGAERIKNVVYPGHKPKALRNGDLIYNVRGGGRVVDTKHHVRVDEVSKAAAFLALAIAADRFDGRPLEVKGTDVFRASVLEAAASGGLDVRFADPSLEAARQSRLRQPTERPREPALDAFIAARNKVASEIPSVLRHRRWKPSDAGAVEYAGKRVITDGSSALLLKRGDEILVKPATQADLRSVRGVRVGTLADVDHRGQVAARARGIER